MPRHGGTQTLASAFPQILSGFLYALKISLNPHGGDSALNELLPPILLAGPEERSVPPGVHRQRGQATAL